MTIYTVHAPPARRQRGGLDELGAVFVKEGFCWPGLLVPLPWLIFRRMSIVLAFTIIAGAALFALARQDGLVPIAMALGAFVPLLLGFEGNDLRRWQLGLRGFQMMGVVEADSLAEAEIRYFTAPADARPAATPPPIPTVRPLPLLPAPEVVGLFPSSGAAS